MRWPAAQMTGHKKYTGDLWLEEMMAEDYRKGRPFRQTVVISKARDGFLPV